MAGRELDVAVYAARQAAKVLVRHFEAGVTAEWKGDRDPVSVADREAEELVRGLLAEAFPDDLIVGEEGNAPSEEVVSSRRRWYVDPLDGTTNFLKRWERWAVSIGFCDDDDVMKAGVVLQPLTDEVFTAVRGQGAHRNGVPISVSGVTRLHDALLVTGTKPHVLADIEQLWPTVLTGRVTGSTALDLCEVARGRADIHVSSNQGRWDLAAGSVIAAEAGAVVLDPQLEATQGAIDGCVIATPALIEPLRPFLRPVRPAPA